MAFPLFLDLHQEMRLYRKKVLKLFVCAHKKHYLCTRNKESKDKRLVKRITEKIDSGNWKDWLGIKRKEKDYDDIWDNDSSSCSICSDRFCRYKPRNQRLQISCKASRKRKHRGPGRGKEIKSASTCWGLCLLAEAYDIQGKRFKDNRFNN